MRIAVLANTTWYLYNFRLNLMLALQDQGHEVFAVGPEDLYVEKIKQAGISHLAFNVSGDGINPLKELKTVTKLYLTLRREKIDLVLSSTPKGNIYAGIAALPSGIKTIANISGLGRTFIKPSMLTGLIKLLYKFIFRYSSHVFFQNNDDRDLFIKYGLVSTGKTSLLPGSGVDLKRFTPSYQHKSSREKTTFLLIARLLWDKGIGEYVEAARKVHSEYQGAQFQLLGQLDAANPAAISRKTVDQWHSEGVIDYLGKTDNVIPYLQAADCVVLPSYREGTPRSLLEAAAMGKPVITTDAAGCRNVVDDKVSGYLCELKSSEGLAEKMLKFIELESSLQIKMGQAGRKKMEQEFDEKIVINMYLEYINKLADRPK